MVKETFYVYKDDKTGMYLKLIADSRYYSSGGSSVVLTDKFESAFRVKDPRENELLKIISYKSNYSPNGIDIWDDFSLMKGGVRNRRYAMDLDIIIEKYCTQTIFLSSELI